MIAGTLLEIQTTKGMNRLALAMLRTRYWYQICSLSSFPKKLLQ
jgi:hypothetical protein